MAQAGGPSVDELRRRVAPVLRRHGVTKAGLFGSAARGELRPESDVDLVVQLPPDCSLLDLVALKHELEDQLGRKADVVEYGALHPLLRERILAEQVTVA